MALDESGLPGEARYEFENKRREGRGRVCAWALRDKVPSAYIKRRPSIVLAHPGSRPRGQRGRALVDRVVCNERRDGTTHGGERRQRERGSQGSEGAAHEVGWNDSRDPAQPPALYVLVGMSIVCTGTDLGS
jgi:hypothetical protein